MTRPVYIMLVGLPASGKTSLVGGLLAYWPDKDDPYLASSDAYIDTYAWANNMTYSEAFKVVASQAMQQMNSDLKDAFAHNTNIIHDQTNLSVAKRRKMLAMVPENYVKIGLYVSCDEETRQVRLKSRPGKEIPESVDNFMLRSYEPMTLDEGFHVITDANNWINVLYPWVMVNPNQQIVSTMIESPQPVS